MTQSQKSRENIYETITSKLLAALEANPGDPPPLPGHWPTPA